MSAPVAPGGVLAPGYEVLEHLNRGQDLDIYDVWSEERDCRCVIKVVRPDAPHADEAAARLRREGRLLRRLTHPHLVRAYELLETASGPVLVLETLDGATVSWLAREAPRPLRASDLANLGLQLGSASTSTGASRNSARAIAMRWRWPPESRRPRWPSRVS